ncbi:hypothetical protein GE21DRAFT_1325302 [Neurospora crassa]|nr:hypothetical protein GE21DRAFT_1325302 [Neurospora crassa]
MVQVGWGWAEDVMEMCGGCCGGQAEEDRRKDAQKPGNGYAAMYLVAVLPDGDDDDDDDEAMACKGSERYSSLTMYPGYVRRGNKGIVDSELMEMPGVKFLFGGFRAKLDDGMSTWSENGSVPAAAEATATATATAASSSSSSSTMCVGGEGRIDTTKPTLTDGMGGGESVGYGSDEEPKGAGPGGRAGFNLMLVLELTEGHKFQKGNLKRQAKPRIQQRQLKQLPERSPSKGNS